MQFYRLVCLLFVGVSAMGAQQLDVAQLAYDETNDLNSNGRSGQSFVATVSGEIIGVRLFLERKGFSSSHPAGSNFTLSLHPVVGGVVRSTAITTGQWFRDEITTGLVVAVDVIFDQPYHQRAGESMAFTIRETSGGGASGWNEYAMQDGDPYLSGTQFYSYSDESALVSNSQDMAFATLVNLDTGASPPPDAFDYMSPADAAEFLQESQPTKLDWADAPNAFAYDIYFEANDSTPDVLIATVLESEWRVPDNLSLGSYSWRVVARNSAGVHDPGSWSFDIVEPLPPLPAPFAGYAPDQAQEYVLPAKPFDLRWGYSSNADFYDVYLEKGDATPDVLVETRSAAFLYYTITESLDEGTWYWKVVARNEAGSRESPVRSFLMKPRLPGSFSLAAPSSWTSYQLPELPVKLDWSDSEGAGSYELILRRTLPSEIIINKTVSESEWMVDSVLAEGDWAWSVTARNVSGGRSSLTRYFTIRPANRAPTGISLSHRAVAENIFSRVRIGSFTTSDPDEVDYFSYSLVGGAGDADNELFVILGNHLEVDQPFNYEARSSYSIRVRSTDSFGEFLEQAFTISVLDLEEASFSDVKIYKRTLGRYQVVWHTEAGFQYQLKYSTSLRPDDWHVLSAWRSPFSENMSFYDTPPDDVGARFYKVERIEER